MKESNVRFDETMFSNLEQYQVIGPVVKLAREQLSVWGADVRSG